MSWVFNCLATKIFGMNLFFSPKINYFLPKIDFCPFTEAARLTITRPKLAAMLLQNHSQPMVND